MKDSDRPEWQQRVITEAKELEQKCVKLRDFFGNDQFLSMDPVDRRLLREQYSAMMSYHYILQDRINRF